MNRNIFLIYGLILISFVTLLIVGVNRHSGLSHTDKNIYFSNSLLLPENFLSGAVKTPEREFTIIFVSTGCDYCNRLINFLGSRKSSNQRSFLIYVFSELPETVSEFIRTQSVFVKDGSIVYLDKNALLKSRFGLKTVPSVFIIRNNRIIQKGIGLEHAKEVLDND